MAESRERARRARASLLLARLVAVALAPACVDHAAPLASSPVAARPDGATRSPPPVSQRPRLGTWAWRKRSVLDSGERQDLVTFAQEKGITDLYIAVADEYEVGDGFAALTDLVRRAERAHVQLFWVAGDPSWALSEHHASALAVVDWAVRVNALLRAASLPEIRALQYDVEPYLLPEWPSEAVEAQYATLLAKVRSATQDAGFELWLDVPFWLEQRAFRATSLGRVAVRSSDGIVVMAYRSSAADVAGKAMSFLGDADAKARSVVVALETSCREPAPTTFCGVSAAKLDSGLADVHDRLASFATFGGLAVHPYEGWRAIGAGSSSTEPRSAREDPEGTRSPRR
jgi:hypothetical protein